MASCFDVLPVKVASFPGSGDPVGPLWVALIGSSLISLVTPLLPWTILQGLDNTMLLSQRHLQNPLGLEAVLQASPKALPQGLTLSTWALLALWHTTGSFTIVPEYWTMWQESPIPLNSHPSYAWYISKIWWWLSKCWVNVRDLIQSHLLVWHPRQCSFCHLVSGVSFASDQGASKPVLLSHCLSFL